ncbi:MAG: PAS domain S-box protein [Chloroflexi bacterium]|uniref:histidine kinase n=1 Tax=Candidatus Chlorohelix allophototropha TaxID=3003348 RepID=A0A8T7M677_9CHLR|nr:PAS domain S-box protein [Chloroflexota bacterium]WJW69539.1 PAS domain S-box protein [Chloroflexota bacterium L227-S17]
MDTVVSNNSYTVLIIEDSVEDRTIVKRFLNQDPYHSYRFEETDMGETGLELCLSRHPDLILLDYSLPDFTGLEFLKDLNERMKELPCPVIVFTGVGNATIATECMKYGAQDYLVKGAFTPENLQLAIQTSYQTYRRKLQERYLLSTSILESISEAFCALDAEERFTYVNHKAEELWNIHQEELQGKKFEEIFPQMASIPEYQYLRQAIVDQTPVKFERYIHAIQRWIKIKVYPAGSGVSVYFEDISVQKQAEEQMRRWNEELERKVEERTAALTTEIEGRKRSEEALSKSEERYRFLTENLTDTISRLSPDGVFEYVSPSCQKILGFTPEELVGHHLLEFIHPDDHLKLLKLQANWHGQNNLLVTYRSRCKSGQYLWVEISAHFTIDSDTGQAINIITVTRDISVRKQAEKVLQRYQLLSENTLEIILFIRPDGTLLEANHAAVLAYGYSIEELQSLNIRDLRAEETRSLVISQMQEAGNKGVVFETLHRRRDGSVFPVEVSSRGIELDDEIVLLSLIRDISERKQAETALHDSEERFRAFMDNSPTAAWIIDYEGRLQYMNRASAHSMKIELENAGSKNLTDYIPPEFVDLILANIQKTYDTAQATLVIEPFPGAVGTKRQALVSLFPIPDPSGQRLIGGIATDITERVRMEEALRQSENRFRSVVNNIKEVFFQTDAEGLWSFLNPAWTEVTGFTVEESLGQNFLNYVYPDDRQRNLELFTPLIERKKEYCRHTIRYLTKAGTPRWIEVYARLTFDEHDVVLGTSGTLRDVHEQRLAEAALRESEERYRFLAENSTDTISRLSYAGVFEYVSPACQKFIGFATEELRGHTFLDFVHPDDHEQFLKLLSNWQGQNNFLVTYRARCKSGHYIWVEASVHLTSNPNTGQVLNVIMVTRDITERLKMEEALNAEKLKAQNLESLGVLAGGIAHSFNNALVGVTGYMSLAKLELEETSDAYACLEEAEKSTQRLTELAQRLVPFASGGAPIKQKVKLENIIKNATSFMNQNSNLRYHFDLPPDLWLVPAEPAQIREALQNLIKNALEAMPEGGIIEVKAANVTLEANQVFLLNPGRYVKVTVQDQGCGIRSEELARIFDPYYTSKFMGNGLGLTLSYSIIRRHGGQLVVESEWGKGTTIHFYLPALPEEAGV